ncbi:MAG: hypothetical protein M1608_13475 [Candidatus Omnitrophica bacterium]|nr:hypothetical protein [Candidatus Omnitrophota bacterium]
MNVSQSDFPGLDDFDEFISKLPPNSVVRLEPGLYRTWGIYQGPNGLAGIQLPPGLRLLGSGAGATVIQLIDVASEAKGWFHILEATGEGTVVQDLTVDCNGANLSKPQVITGAIQLKGHRSIIRNVEIKGIGHWDPNCAEAFFVSIIEEGDKDLRDVLVDGLRFNGPVLGDTSKPRQFTMLLVTNNHGKPVLNARIVACSMVRTDNEENIYGQAITTAEAVGAAVDHNYVENFGTGYYQDNYSCHGVIIRDNVFRNVRAGIHLDNSCSPDQVFESIHVSGNRIDIQRTMLDSQWYWGGILFLTDATGKTPTNVTQFVTIRDNLVRFFDGQPQGNATNTGIMVAQYYGDHKTLADYATIENNIIDMTTPNAIQCDVDHYRICGNTDFQRNLLPAWDNHRKVLFSNDSRADSSDVEAAVKASAKKMVDAMSAAIE